MRLLIAAGALTLLLAGCGSSAAAPTTTTTLAPQDAVSNAATHYSALLNQGNGKAAYAMWSEHCKTTKTEAQVVDIAKVGVMFATAKMLSVNATVDGNTAKVSEHWDMTVLDKTDQSWTNESGAWKWNGCADA